MSNGSDALGSNGRGVGGEAATSLVNLELRFAKEKNPTPGVYLPLCEAYLAENRVMEAVVVCRKVIKADASALPARLMMARLELARGKAKRAEQELAQLLDLDPRMAGAYWVRGSLRASEGQEAEAIQDFKTAVDLDPGQKEAIAALSERGIVYPEAKPEPVLSRPSVDLTGDLGLDAGGPRAGASQARGGPVQTIAVVQGQSVRSRADADPSAHRAPGGRSSAVQVGPAGVAQPGHVVQPGQAMQPGQVMQPAQVGGQPIQGNLQVGNAGMPQRVQPMRLEDDLELFRLEEAEKKKEKGSPKATIFLAILLVIGGSLFVGYRFYTKRKVEAIDRLTSVAKPAFNRDTYGGYKQAANALKSIVSDYDAKHPLSLGRLAETYAILYAEHGERDAETTKQLESTLSEAKRYAPEVSFTVSAEATYKLATTKDRTQLKALRHELEDAVKRLSGDGTGVATQADLALAKIEMKLGDYDEAFKRLTRTKDVLLGSVRAKVLQAQAANKARRLSAAQAGFESALRAEADHPGALSGLALVLLERGNLDAAAKILQRFDASARAHPKDVSDRDRALAEFARSVIFRSAGEDAKASGAYEIARRLDPKNPDFPYGLGSWLLKNDRAKEAIKPLQEAVKMEPDRWAFYVELAEAEMWARDFDAADKHLKEALSRNPDYRPAILARARYLRRTKASNTESYLKDYLKGHPSAQVEVNLELGRLYRAERRFPEAQKVLEEAIKAMDAYPAVLQGNVLMSYGRLMTDMGQVDTAVNAFQNAARLGDMEGYFRLSLLLARRTPRKAKQACEAYLRAGSSLRYSKEARQLCESL